MRTLISALLLALTGNRPDLKCTGNELTNSYIPAGMQVLSHYTTQLKQLQATSRTGKAIEVTGPALIAPIIEVIYNGSDGTSTYVVESDKNVEKLEELSSVLDAEARAQVLQECKGLAQEVIKQLEKTSGQSAKEQLTFILKSIRGGELLKTETGAKVKALLSELENVESDLNKELKSVQPLKYLSDLSLE